MKYTFSVRRLGEEERHCVVAASEDDAWKQLAMKVNMKNVDKVFIVSYG